MIVLLNFVFEFLFPKRCVFCDTNGGYICTSCRNEKLILYNDQSCHVCKLKISNGFVHERCKVKTNLDGVIVCVFYNNSAKVLIEELKYKFFYAIAPEIGNIMKTRYEKSSLSIKTGVPVPLHWFKKNYRGFNQAELFARHIFGKENTLDCLNRKKKTKTQVGMTKIEREENLKEVFILKYQIPHESIILVDDVMTTGTTLEECAKCLKSNQIKEVYAIVFARG